MKKQQTCAYLYADGHAVILYEQRVKIGGTMHNIEYAVIHEQWTKASLQFKGRICISRYGSSALMDLLRRADRISAKEPTLEHGSDNTKKLGIPVGSLHMDFPDGSYLYFHWIPSLLGGQFTYQPDHVDVFNGERMEWGNCKVAEIKRKPSEQVA